MKENLSDKSYYTTTHIIIKKDCSRIFWLLTIIHESEKQEHLKIWICSLNEEELQQLTEDKS